MNEKFVIFRFILLVLCFILNEIKIDGILFLLVFVSLYFVLIAEFV